jgi:hypothetical protein
VNNKRERIKRQVKKSNKQAINAVGQSKPLKVALTVKNMYDMKLIKIRDKEKGH